MQSRTLVFTIFLLTIFLNFACKNGGEGVMGKHLYKGPIIDMHVHALEVRPEDPRMAFCYPASTMIEFYDPREDWFEVLGEMMANPKCSDPIWSAKSTEELVNRSADQFKTYNITPVVGGRSKTVKKWDSLLESEVVRSIGLQIGNTPIAPDSIRILFEQDSFILIGEIANQYKGVAPNSPEMDPYYAIAEDLDIPIAIHMGSGAPGSPLGLDPEYSVALSNPILLEEVLKKYPKLRVSIMHYGEPFIDELIALLYHYPHVYIDIGGIQWTYPSDYFYEYHLKKIVAAGFVKRIMFGSDAMLWPELIGKSIDIINQAQFLTYEQKEDIFYNNALRFLRLK